MRKIIKKLVKILIIYIVMTMLILSNVCYGYTQEEVGDAIAGFAAHVVSEYGDQVEYGQRVGENSYTVDRTWNPIWSPDTYTWNDTSTYGFDCSSFSSGCIHAVTGLLDCALNTTGLIGLSGDSNFEVFRFTGLSDLMPGDVVVHDDGQAHAVVYLGQEYSAWDTTGNIANNGSKFRSDSYFANSYTFYIVRVSSEGASNLTSLNTEFASGSISSSSSSGVNLSNFYFNGIPDGKYSVAHTSILTTIIENLASIADYLIGILTYLIRVVIVGWTSLIDRLFTWSVNTVVDTGVDAEDLNVSSVEVESADNDDRITIEKLLYNEYDLTNINIFDNDDNDNTDSTNADSDTNADDTDNLEISEDTEDMDTTGDIQ